MAERIRLKEIAAATGFSVTTVCVVLDGKADRRGIAQATQRKIIRAAARLGYRPNRAARTLRTGRSNRVAIVGINLMHPVPLTTTRCAMQALQGHGYDIALFDFGWQLRSGTDPAQRLLDLGPEGVLLVTPCDSANRTALRGLARRGVPVIAFLDNTIPEADVVTVDREVGAYEATKYLLELGHRRIALTVAPDATPSVLRQRLTGFRRAHAECKVRVDPALFLPPREPGQQGFESGGELTPLVLAHPAKPTAVFCSNDLVATGMLQALHAAGKRVPDDFSLIGFDGTDIAAQAMVPLTTVEQPFAEVAELAVTRLVERLKAPGSPPLPPQRLVVPSRLVLRASCRAVAASGN